MFEGSILTRKPELGYKPNNPPIDHWLFPLKDYKDNEDAAAEECNLATAVSLVALRNGISTGELHRIFPLILRMLKSNSVWAK